MMVQKRVVTEAQTCITELRSCRLHGHVVLFTFAGEMIQQWNQQDTDKTPAGQQKESVTL